jgi:hypothetical protein
MKACNFWNVIEILCLKLVVRTKNGAPSILHTLLAQTCKKSSTCLCKQSKTLSLRAKIDLLGDNLDKFLFIFGFLLMLRIHV